MQRRRFQRGAALLTAMVIVTLVATLAASMVWQQWRAVQIEASERSRAQSYWILNGALDWAILILREDAKAGGVDHLGEPWAVPLAEARLSSFLAADKENTQDSGPEAFLSGQITDEQARYNLRNLVDATGKLQPQELQTLQALCEYVGVPTSLAQAIGEGLQQSVMLASGAASSAATTNDAPLMPPSVDQLEWLGLNSASLAPLRPYVTLLPVPTPINLNTASKEVIAAVIPGLNLAIADRLVQARQRQPFKDVSAAQSLLPNQQTALGTQRVDVRTSYFEVRGRLRLEDRVVEERSLVQRHGINIVVLRRERVASVEAVPGRQ